MERAVAAREHITHIRDTKFSVGSKLQNPLTRDLHNAVTRLSSELYAKDILFLMELIQNAEDNKYASNVEPSLEFVFIKEDITGIGAPATLLVFNNEVGFSKADIDSLCSIGQSTKKAKRSEGFIGEKGIGFKSVFLVSAHPYIFSNGYQIRFCEVPNGDSGIGYIVPEWITERPSMADLKRVYSNGVLPTTTIILPLKSEKVDSVMKELLQIHPEVILFLQKIKRLTVRGDHAGLPLKDSVSAVAISNETTLVPSINEVVDSLVVKLSAQQGSKMDTCRYYLHKQIFPIKSSMLVEARKGVKELMICLAFPFDKRLKTGPSAAGIFAFLPTGMVTNFPFIIHSDFLLASSREVILMDNRWNLGCLELVPSAYVRALITCMNSVESIGLGTKSNVLGFLPIKESPFPEINSARDSINLMLQSECIVPCESFSNEQIILCRPSDAIVISSMFRRILVKAKQHRICLGDVSSQLKCAIHDSVDSRKYHETLKFLGVASASGDTYDWYLKFIKTSNLLTRASEELYIDIICFLADNWAHFPDKSVNNIPILKYVVWSGDVMWCSVLQAQQKTVKIRIVWDADEHAWLSNWNQKICCPKDVFFCPDNLVNSLVKRKNQGQLKEWFTSTAGVVVTDTFSYCMELITFIREKKDPEIVISLTHFVYFSTMKKFMKYDIQRLLRFLPVVEKSGKVSLCSRSLVPAATGTWTRLFGRINPLSAESDNVRTRHQHDLFHHNGMDGNKQNCGYYAELGDVYSAAAEFNGETIAGKDLLNFLVKNEKAFDLPYASPPDIALKLTSNELTCDQALLLLKWIQNLRLNKQREVPARFYESLKSIEWLKTHAGFRCPKECYLLGSGENKAILDLGRKLNVLSAIDEVHYSFGIRNYIDELHFIKVQAQTETMSELIIPHVKRRASYAMEPTLAFLLLDFIKHLWENDKLHGELKKNLKEGKWLKTLNGFTCPSESILFAYNLDDDLANVLSFSFIDESYYGNKIKSYKAVLEAIGVIVSLESAGMLVVNRLKSDISSFRSSANKVISLLRLLKSAKISNVVSSLSGESWIKTKHGYQYAVKSILFDSEWAAISQLIDLPFIDETFYGAKICSFKEELKSLGAVVNFRDGLHFIVHGLKIQESPSLVTADIAFSILKCAGSLVNSNVMADKILREELLEKLRVAEWVKTHMGYKRPSEALLFKMEWKCHLKENDGPFIDLAFYTKITSEQTDVLRAIGVKMGMKDVCNLIVKNINAHVEINKVKRIYKFLQKCLWKPESEQNLAHMLLIPGKQDSSKGKWVDNVDCVIHDEGNLFGHCLYSLDNYYDKELLPFLQSTFNVPEFPSLDHYAALWKAWCESAETVSVEKLKSFWGQARNWAKDVLKNQVRFQSTFSRIPAVGASRKDIQLLEKQEVYIGDELLLKKAFTESSGDSFFAWFPDNDSISSACLFGFYKSLGVKNISESVEYSVNGDFQKLEKHVDLIGKPLLKLVMAFLASSQMSIPVPANERYSRVKSLRLIPMFGTDELVQVKYNLQLPVSKKCLNADINKKVFYDSNEPRFLVHTPSWSNRHKDIKLINDFARAISEAVLCDTQSTQDLIKLIKMGFAFLLAEDDIDDLLMSENLEVPVGDQEFLDELLKQFG